MDSTELNHTNLPPPTLDHHPPLSSNGTPQIPDSSNPVSDSTTTKTRRRSRWDPQPSETSINTETSNGTRKRKSRWADDETTKQPNFQLPDFMKGIEFDPEIQILNTRLLDISRILQSGLPLDDRDESNRSPSPEPVYDNMGIRVNTREYRAREKLNKQRQEIISNIIKKNPAFKPPADYRPPKLQKKLYIPEKEYPGYGFMGLIIGPRGNTQKRMQNETGAKIVIRGKGSVKEGRFKQKKDMMKYDPSENEDLHVLVEADTREALDAAVGMIEKLLQPVDEVMNEHKRQQLKELATLNGTIRDGELCRQCGETGHRQFACPLKVSTFKSDVLCKVCGDGGHPTIDCPVKGTVGKKMDDEYLSFLAEVGGTVPESSVKQSTTLAIGNGSEPPWSNGGSAHPGLGSTTEKFNKEYDEANLYIGFLPPMLEDDGLISLFLSFGDIEKAKVIKDRETGLSRGYGFVKYTDVQMANTAVHAMNGYRLEGKTLAVRIAGKPPPPPAPPVAQPPTQGYPPPPSGAYPPQQYATNGQLPNPPPVGYSTAPVPWGPPVPSYYQYAPPPPVPGQHYAPYGMHYPPPPPPPHLPQAPPPGTTPQYPPSSESQQSYPPGVQADNGAPAPPNVYMSSVTGNAPWAPQPPMPPTVGYSQSMGNVPWPPEPPAQPPAENPSAVGDSEYDKFMAELKYDVLQEKLPSKEV